MQARLRRFYKKYKEHICRNILLTKNIPIVLPRDDDRQPIDEKVKKDAEDSLKRFAASI